MGQRCEQTSHWRRYTDGKKADKKMFYIVSQENENLSHSEISLEWSKSSTQTTPNDKDVE